MTHFSNETAPSYPAEAPVHCHQIHHLMQTREIDNAGKIIQCVSTIQHVASADSRLDIHSFTAFLIHATEKICRPSEPPTIPLERSSAEGEIQ